jgi:phage shock protein E
MKTDFKSAFLGLCVLLCSVLAAAEIPDNAVWIDVRTQEEWREGHLSEATLIPHDGIEKGVAALGLAKDTPIYLYCRSGNRAGQAKLRLEAIQYSQVTNVGSLEEARKLSGGTKP